MIQKVECIFRREKKMTMEAFDTLLQDLMVIGSVDPNHQLYTRTQHIYTAEASALQSFYRMCMGESRAANLVRVDRTVQCARAQLRELGRQASLLVKTEQPNNYEDKCKRGDVVNRINQLVRALEKVKQGLCVLKNTYKGDSATAATLDVIAEHIDDELRLVGKPGK